MIIEYFAAQEKMICLIEDDETTNDRVNLHLTDNLSDWAAGCDVNPLGS